MFTGGREGSVKSSFLSEYHKKIAFWFDKKFQYLSPMFRGGLILHKNTELCCLNLITHNLCLDNVS